MMKFSLYNTLSRIAAFTFVVAATTCTITGWALEELGVLGEVEPARPYYERFIVKSKDQTSNEVQLAPKDQARIDQWSAQHNAYDSGLTLGQFSPIPITEYNERILVSMCLVANDVESLSWLKKHRANLNKIKPVCYLVRKDNESGITALKKAFSELNFVAVNPKYIIETYSIPHYPALISKQGIEQ